MTMIKPYKKCKKCGALIVSGDLCEDCKPMTNADRIRQMTDEELANWITDGHDLCDLCQFSTCRPDFSCEEGVLAWLRKEVIEDAGSKTD